MAIKKIVESKFTAKDGVTKRFSLMERAAARFGRNTDRSFKRASRSASRFKDITQGILAANLIGKGFQAASRGIFSFITEASKVEDAVAGFTPILGGISKANKLVEMLNQTAASTPFQFENITDVAKQLLPVMNGNLKDTISTFRMLGDTAGGNVQKLDSITRGYVKALLKGKPDMESLNMIAEAGVPIFSEMAKSMGVTQEQFFELSKKGKLTSADLTKVFKQMTSEGGMFFGGMEIASKTFTGKMSTLTDNVKLAAGALGTAFLPILKDLADRLIVVAARFRVWAMANQDLIKSKINDFIRGAVNLFYEMKPLLIDVFTIWTKMASAMSGSDFSSLISLFKGLNIVLRVTLQIINLIAKGFDVVGKFLGTSAAKFMTAKITGTGSLLDALETSQQGKTKAPPTRIAPNQQEASAKAQFPGFKGQLNIAGAPEGSTLETSQPGPAGFSVAMLGQN